VHRTVILHSCDILSWAPVPSNECRSTGLYGAIKADLKQRSSSSTRKCGATCTQLWIEWLPQRVPSNGERLYIGGYTVHSRYNVHPDSHKSARLKFKVACIRFAEEI